MRFTPWGLYTHRNMLDAAILIVKAFRKPSGDWKLRVRWMRKDGWDFGVMENIRIKAKDVDHWERVTGLDYQETPAPIWTGK